MLPRSLTGSPPLFPVSRKYTHGTKEKQEKPIKPHNPRPVPLSPPFFRDRVARVSLGNPDRPDPVRPWPLRRRRVPLPVPEGRPLSLSSWRRPVLQRPPFSCVLLLLAMIPTPGVPCLPGVRWGCKASVFLQGSTLDHDMSSVIPSYLPAPAPSQSTGTRCLSYP